MPEQFDVELNLKGLPCPLPIVKAGKGIKEVPIGGVLKCIATDPGAVADFAAWAKTTGNELVKSETNGNELIFYIKRLK